MKVLIKKNSIKKNKNAGEPQTMIRGQVYIDFECSDIPDFFIDGENVYINSVCVSHNNKPIYSGTIIDEKTYKRALINKKDDMVINYNSTMSHVMHQPIPEYSYEYENPICKCSVCKRDFDFNELQSDEFFEDMCPHCGISDCIEYKLETIEEALKR